jgi:tetratricopeptide (TPR) repeat protein
MRDSWLLALLLLGALLVACPSPQERAEQAREEARQALARGDRGAALESLDALRKLRPERPAELLELAALLVAAGEAPQVVWLLEEGIRRFPEHVELRLALARVALLVGDASAAQTALRPIDAASEHHAAALLLRAQAELRLGDLEQALATLAAAQRLHPDRPEAHLARISALLSERRFEEARQALEEGRQALRAAGEEAALRRIEISLYSLEAERGETEAAIVGLRALVEADPADVQAWRAFVNALGRDGRAEEAIQRLQSAIEDDPERLQLHPMLSLLLASAGRGDEAERVLRDLVERAPSPTAYLALAGFHARQQDDTQALRLIGEALAEFPDAVMLQRSLAETLLSLENNDRARGVIARYRELFPDDPNAEYLRARLELADGDAAAAAARLTKLMPRLDQAVTQHWLGQALEAQGDRAGAERRYALALARDSREPGLYGPLIRLAEARGDWRGVASLGRRLVQLAPGLYEGWAALVLGLVNLGDGEAAEPIARRCGELFPERLEAQLLLARALRAAGRHDDALRLLVEARERFGSAPDIEAERALTLGMGGRVGEGVTVAREALATSPETPELHVTLAALLFGVGQADEGARAVDRALELAPDDPQPLRIRAEFRAATGRLDGARRDCERYLEQRPDDPTVHFMLGVVHEQAGRPERAIASYRRAAELDPTAFAPRNNLANLLSDRDLDSALAAAQEAYALAPDSPYVLDTLGWLYLRKGVVERATSLLEEAHAGAPAAADAQLHLALAYRETGRADDARRLLTDLEGRADAPAELQARVDEALRSLP